MRPLLLAIALLGAGVSLGASRLAHADQRADNEAEARAAVRRGLAAFARGEAAVALQEYRRAQELVPDANLPYRYAGEALLALGRVDEALASYEKYIAINPSVSDADLVRGRIAEIKQKYLAILNLTTSPPGAEIRVDGELVGVSPLAKYSAKAGPHTIVVRREGYEPVTLHPDLKAGTPADLSVDLPPAGAAPRPSGPSGESSGGPPAAAWVVLGVGTAAILGGALVDYAVLGPKIDEFHDASHTDVARARSLQSSASGMRTALWVTYIAGAALAATGGVWIWLSSRHSTSSVRVGAGQVDFVGHF